MGTIFAAGTSVAAAYLAEQHGMQILGQDWSCADGVLDLVAACGQTLVVCVVRPEKRALTPVKRARVRRLAVRWVAAGSVLLDEIDEIRIDTITVTADGQGRALVTEHMEGI